MSLKRLPFLLARNSLMLPQGGYTITKRPIHVCSSLSAGQKWRMRQGKSRTGNEYGPLTDLPDWSYTDGRPSVLGKGQLRRKVKQFAFSQRIRRLLDEMDAAKAAGGQPGVSADDEEMSFADEEREEADQLEEEVVNQTEDGADTEDKQSQGGEADVKASHTN